MGNLSRFQRYRKNGVKHPFADVKLIFYVFLLQKTVVSFVFHAATKTYFTFFCLFIMTFQLLPVRQLGSMLFRSQLTEELPHADTMK